MDHRASPARWSTASRAFDPRAHQARCAVLTATLLGTVSAFVGVRIRRHFDDGTPTSRSRPTPVPTRPTRGCGSNMSSTRQRLTSEVCRRSKGGYHLRSTTARSSVAYRAPTRGASDGSSTRRRRERSTRESLTTPARQKSKTTPASSATSRPTTRSTCTSASAHPRTGTGSQGFGESRWAPSMTHRRHRRNTCGCPLCNPPDRSSVAGRGPSPRPTHPLDGRVRGTRGGAMNHATIDPIVTTNTPGPDCSSWSRGPAPSRYLADPDVLPARIHPFRRVPSPRTGLLRDFLRRPPSLPSERTSPAGLWGGTGADDKSGGEVLYEDFFPVRSAPGTVSGATAVTRAV